MKRLTMLLMLSVTILVSISPLANPSPAAAQTVEVMVTVGSPDFKKSGPESYWRSATSANGGMLWTQNNTSQVENYVRWYGNFPQEGMYEVFAFIPDHDATTTNASYSINHRDDHQTVSINQLQYNNEWVSLGAYPFKAGRYQADGGLQWVFLSDRTGEAAQSRQVGFSAVRFVLQGRGSSQPPSQSGRPVFKDVHVFSSPTLEVTAGDHVRAVVVATYVGGSGPIPCGQLNLGKIGDDAAPFRDDAAGSWRSPNRVAAVNCSGSVDPGEQAHWDLTFHAPPSTSPGTYETGPWAPVFDGVAWSELSISVRLNVTAWSNVSCHGPERVVEEDFDTRVEEDGSIDVSIRFKVFYKKVDCSTYAITKVNLWMENPPHSVERGFPNVPARSPEYSYYLEHISFGQFDNALGRVVDGAQKGWTGCAKLEYLGPERVYVISFDPEWRIALSQGNNDHVGIRVSNSLFCDVNIPVLPDERDPLKNYGRTFDGVVQIEP